MLFKEIITIYSDNQTSLINTFGEQIKVTNC
jgi:hypothetical protein